MLPSSASLDALAEVNPPLEDPSAAQSLDSLLPLLKQLQPASLMLKDGAYYIHGRVKKEDWNRLSDLAGRVTTFTLSDPKLASFFIAPETFLRLAQLQGADTSLFPALNRLRLIDANASLAHLFLFLSPSLKTLEVRGLPESRQSTFHSFLDALVDEAKDLQEFILGPGKVTTILVQTLLRFKPLRHLELNDALGVFDFAFLEQVGSLPHLETFIIDARSASYLLGSNTRNDEKIAHPTLKKLTVVGNVLLIGDILFEINSTGLVEANLKFITSIPMKAPWWSPPGISSQSPGPTLKEGGKNATPPNESQGGEAPVDHPVRTIKTNTRVPSSLAFKFQAPSPVASQPFMASEAMSKYYDVIFERLSAVSGEHLESVTISHLMGTNFSRPVLHAENLKRFLLNSSLNSLIIEDWNTFPDSSLCALKSIAPSRLQILELPIGDNNSGISLSTLLIIAESCPQLRRLQVRLDNVPTTMPDTAFTTDATSNPLEVLSVGSDSLQLNQQLLLGRYLYSLFPHLATVQTHVFNNAEQWVFIHTLIKMCQSVRKVDAVRRSLHVDHAST